MGQARVFVSLTEAGTIKAEMWHPVYDATLWIICDRQTGDVIRTNFDRRDYADRFERLVAAAREQAAA